jgi:hypothetical protein
MNHFWVESKDVVVLFCTLSPGSMKFDPSVIGIGFLLERMDMLSNYYRDDKL